MTAKSSPAGDAAENLPPAASPAPPISDALARLRAPFELDEIELLPKYTGPKQDGKVPQSAKQSCKDCGGYHGFPCVHLSYVGHAGVTKRLLDVDPGWNWEPVAINEDGTPKFTDGGLWIRLTVLEQTRLGYGDAGDKHPPFTGSAVKEIIGDAIRNAAMRFGVGTYLWSKSDAAKAELTRQGVEDEATAQPEAPAEDEATRVKRSSVPQQQAIHFKWGKLGNSEPGLKKRLSDSYGTESTKDLTFEQAKKILDALDAALKAKAEAPAAEPVDPEPEPPAEEPEADDGFDENAEDIPF
jgi:hypothetical protein